MTDMSWSGRSGLCVAGGEFPARVAQLHVPAEGTERIHAGRVGEEWTGRHLAEEVEAQERAERERRCAERLDQVERPRCIPDARHAKQFLQVAGALLPARNVSGWRRRG